MDKAISKGYGTIIAAYVVYGLIKQLFMLNTHLDIVYHQVLYKLLSYNSTVNIPYCLKVLYKTWKSLVWCFAQSVYRYGHYRTVRQWILFYGDLTDFVLLTVLDMLNVSDLPFNISRAARSMKSLRRFKPTHNSMSNSLQAIGHYQLTFLVQQITTV